LHHPQKIKVIAGSGIILVLAGAAFYMLYFSRDRVDPAAADANARAAAAIAEESAKAPPAPPPPPEPTKAPEGTRGPH
jgi:hypothetical protein